MGYNTHSLFGFEISSTGLSADIEYAWTNYIRKGRGCTYMACANPHSLVTTKHDSEFRYALRNADILLPDGAGIVIAAKLLGKGIKERVTGSDFFIEFTKRANKVGGLRYFFLGSNYNVLTKIKNRIDNEYPNVDVCGYYSPPYKETFTQEEEDKMIAVINASKADVLWVGMTAPKQEKWIYRNRERLDVSLACAIGAVFDFYAGTQKRAPAWLCDIGLEWLYRLCKEPIRLWRRNFISTPVFLFWILRERITSYF